MAEQTTRAHREIGEVVSGLLSDGGNDKDVLVALIHALVTTAYHLSPSPTLVEGLLIDAVRSVCATYRASFPAVVAVALADVVRDLESAE